MKILLIDDEEDIRRIAKLSLARLGGMEVVEASSGEEGVRKAFIEQPDVILLDVMMPAMDGPTTLSRLQSRPQTNAIPVIFLTAKALQFETDRLMALGAVGVLSKPFDPMSLASEIRSILSR